jgi:hypothetical protein
MNPIPNHKRHARLQRECSACAVPALLLAVVCAALALRAALPEPPARPTVEQIEQPGIDGAASAA